jgi:hypothetical protein
VASIYLICAIYKGHFEFAPSGYLKDDSEVSFKKYNTVERVAKAWLSVEAWINLLKVEGLAALRARGADPLASSGFHF